MSNYLAIATVTAGIRQLIRDAVESAVSGATITVARPDAPANGTPDPRVNIFLYQIAPNPTWRNADLPSYRSDGTPVGRPTAAIDLFYLFSFYGEESRLEPQVLLGSTVSRLHARPILTHDTIRQAIAADTGTLLQDSNLAEQIESIRLSPIGMNLEELSKLWSIFFQTPYALSVAYQCSAVFVEADVTPRPALPVRVANLRAIPFGHPTIDRVVPAGGAAEPITSQSTIALQGSGFAGENAQMTIGENSFAPTSMVEDEATLDLSTVQPRLLRPGVQGIRISYSVTMDDATVIERVIESNLAAFVLSPEITRIQILNQSGTGDAPRSADIELRIRPHVGKRQRVTLLMNEFNAPSNRPPHSYAFEAPSRDLPDEPESANTITVPISGVQAGRYVTRVRIDGAESPLGTNAGGVYANPRINLT